MRLTADVVEILACMTPTQRGYLDTLLRGNILWLPKSLPQLNAYISEADVLFYGGAAGGGKSDLLLGLSITTHKKSIIFRREYPQLRELIDRSHEILGGTSAKYHGTSARWDGIPGNRILEFGALQHERFKEKYKGRPHDLKAFDEVCDFTETQFRFITAWARTTDPDQRVRIACAGNPPTTPEGEWVLEYWAPWVDEGHSNPARPGELRWFAAIEGKDHEVESGKHFKLKGETIEPKSRTFIPALLDDNPYLRDTDYRATLQALPEPLRSQLLLADFSAAREDQARQVIPTEWVQMAQARWTDRPPEDAPLTAVGCDPARGGADKTTISKLYGTWFSPVAKFEGRETPDGPTAVAVLLEYLGPERAPIGIDLIGIGSSVYDILQSNDNLETTGVNFAERTEATDRSGRLRFHNLRAEVYWRFREALEPELGMNIALPPDKELRQELTAPTWTVTSKGILIQPKKDIRKLLKRSPNCADAVVMAWWLGGGGMGVFFR